MSKFLELCCPAEYVESVSCIDVQGLKQRHIDALLVDLDNTLVPWQGYEIKPEVLDWLREVKAQGIKVCIVSNTRTARRLRKLAEEFDVPFAKKALKPRRGGFREALKLLDIEPARAAVVGDQIFTDILGGNRLGVYTILVDPLYRREFFGTKISRLFEKLILRKLRRQGKLSIGKHCCSE